MMIVLPLFSLVLLLSSSSLARPTFAFMIDETTTSTYDDFHHRLLQQTNSRGIAYPDMRYTPFSQLDAATQTLVQTELGYNETTWDLPGTAEIEFLSWTSLESDAQRDAATQIGFDEIIWDCYQNHYEDYDWFELQQEGVYTYFETLGWSETSWENNGDRLPPSENTTWFNLTSQERAAATELCFFEETWDGNLSMPEWPQFQATLSPAPTSPAAPTATPTNAPTILTLNIEYPEFRYKAWTELNAETKTIATDQLGYNETTWDLPGSAIVETLRWSSLDSSTQQAGATELGFVESTWNCYQNHYEGFLWTELRQEGVQRFFETLGWSEESWEGLDDPPATENTTWAELTQEEQDAAEGLCYFNYTWDADVPIPSWSVETVPTMSPLMSPTMSPSMSSPDASASGATTYKAIFSWSMLLPSMGMLLVGY